MSFSMCFVFFIPLFFSFLQFRWLESVNFQSGETDRHPTPQLEPSYPMSHGGRWRLWWFGVFHPTKPGSATRTRPNPTGGQPYLELYIEKIKMGRNWFFNI